jgi:hypothetical protein
LVAWDSAFYIKRYECLGELTDIEDSISKLQRAVQSFDKRNPSLPVYLGDLGVGLLKRYERLGKLTDIEGSISNLQLAVLSFNEGHLYIPMNVGNLGTSLLKRFERLGEFVNLEAQTYEWRSGPLTREIQTYRWHFLILVWAC